MSYVFIDTRLPKTLIRFVLSCGFVFASLSVQSAIASSLTIQWAANSEPDLAGYRVYQGTSSGSYGHSAELGNTTRYTAQNLQPGVRYYFTLTAFDNAGNESIPSPEISSQIPAGPADPVQQKKLSSELSARRDVIVGTVSNEWSISGIGDLDGDGKVDLVWRGASGAVVVWHMDGSTIVSQGSPGTVSTDWTIVDVNDLDGDGKMDLVWRHTTSGAVAIWQMDGSTVVSQGSPGTVSIDWTIVGVNDLDGDGKGDLVWRHSTSGVVAIWQMDGSAVVSQASPGTESMNWTIVGVDDLDGDGKSDLIVRNTSIGAVSGWLMNGLN